jgi:hypothetical protein
LRKLTYFDTLWECKATVTKTIYHLITGFGRIEFEDFAKRNGFDWHTEKAETWTVTDHTCFFIASKVIGPLLTQIIDPFSNSQTATFALCIILKIAQKQGCVDSLQPHIEHILYKLAIPMVTLSEEDVDMFEE